MNNNHYKKLMIIADWAVFLSNTFTNIVKLFSFHSMLLIHISNDPNNVKGRTYS